MSTSIQADLAGFQELQDNVCTYLEGNSSGSAREMYRSMDAVYTADGRSALLRSMCIFPKRDDVFESTSRSNPFGG
ncbi:unnamed protein product [Ectocarpus sp. 6 AP-2014]